jgi:hypothetical protein
MGGGRAMETYGPVGAIKREGLGTAKASVEYQTDSDNHDILSPNRLLYTAAGAKISGIEGAIAGYILGSLID